MEEGNDCMTTNFIGGEEKVFTGVGKQHQRRYLTWSDLNICNACLTAYVRKQKYIAHIKTCVGGDQSRLEFSNIPHVEHFEDSEFKETLKVPIVASFDTESCSCTEIRRRLKNGGEVYKSDERKEAEMCLTAVVATVIVRCDTQLDYTLYKDISMTDEELLTYNDTIPSKISSLIDDNDLCDITNAVIYFREAMDDYMNIKAEIVNLYVDITSKPAEECEIGEEMDDKLHNEILLQDKREELIGKRIEASRRFGMYFFCLFQQAMEATKKRVLFSQKKTLNLMPKDRLKLLQPLHDQIVDMTKEGLITNKTEWSVYYLDEETKRTKRENGYKSDFLNCDNSVSQTKELNCKICNHKLDPIYIENLYHHNYRQANRKKTTEDDDKNDKGNEEEEYKTIIVDGCVKQIRKNDDDANNSMSTADVQREILMKKHFGKQSVQSTTRNDMAWQK